MCFGNQHTFTWGSSTSVDAMPLSLRCECGAMTREDIAPLKQLQAEMAAAVARERTLRGALEIIAKGAWRRPDAVEVIREMAARALAPNAQPEAR